MPLPEDLQERAAFRALLAPYDLRDGHDPESPFAPSHDYVGRGWFGIVKELVEDLIRLGWNREVLQIKEKFGTLRFYIRQCAEPLQIRIVAAREHSAEVCETCGRGGALRCVSGYPVATRCDPCWEALCRRIQSTEENP
jgi:hypothetical protein